MSGQGDPFARVRQGFARQPMMATLGARLIFVSEGEVHIAAGGAERLRQQHGFMHGGLLMTIADSAAGFAAMTMVAPAEEVLTIEFKMNFLRPASGAVVAKGRVVRAGRRLTVCQADVFAQAAAMTGPADPSHAPPARQVHAATALASFAVVMPEDERVSAPRERI